MKLKTTKILGLLKVMAWIVCSFFTAFSLYILITYIISINSPDAINNLTVYKDYSISPLYQHNFWLYSLYIFITTTILILNALVWYKVARIISNIELNNPFTKHTSRKLEWISFILFAIGFITIALNLYLLSIKKIIHAFQLQPNFVQYFFVAALIFIISQIFKRGVELQSENELTV